jgi:hypothetical protein
MRKLFFDPKLGARRIKNWDNEAAYDLWFELPDALERIPQIAARWKLTDRESDLLRKWVTEGYFTLTDLFEAADIDRYAAEVDSAWFAKRAVKKMTISDVVVGDKKHIHLPHEDLLALSMEERLKSKDASNWRIGEFHLFNDAARKIFDNPHVARLCSALFDRPAYPHFSLTFSKGSMQLLHQDACVFHTWPINALIGVWTALEDINADSGPLVYYPGSHREPLFHEFDNYPQTQRRTASQEQSDRYQDYVARIAEKYERKEFLAKKGEVLFWHGMLVHGGSQFVAPGTTRKSFVIHYLPKGGNVAHSIKGPFNW